ncbi:hypothetical protein [Pseudopedobacter sp.]|uniref:hypothetical protein n=1 Tax=Pseudopedobacter sp. TaxID=1936787 RepID=UPI0033426551
MRLLTLFIFILALYCTACKDNSSVGENSEARLFFSTDSVLFDTIFTDKGSTTRTIKVFNYNKHKILINELALSGGNTSSFKININGLTTNTLSNIEIAGNDSIYVFVKAFIDPNSSDSPFLIEDSLLMTYNGRMQKLPLVAYGQNAVYMSDEKINTNITFQKGKPYVFYGNNTVTNGTVLSLDPGVRMFFHKKAKLTINGSLQANGSLNDSITFASDRMERIYRDEPGQWEGLHFTSRSKDNHLNFCIIKNALTGIQVDSLSSNNNTKLLITNSIIKNHQVAGIIANNGEITGINNLIFNCGQFLLSLSNGGKFQFYQNTFAGYNFSMSRNTAAIFISNSSLSGNNTLDLSANFINNIIWGNNRNEIELKKTEEKLFDVEFKSNLIKTDTPDQIQGNNNVFNIDPLFINPRYDIFQLSHESAFLKYGENINIPKFNTFIMKDLKGIDRLFPSTLGCFQKN